jgi:hypothetical protein
VAGRPMSGTLEWPSKWDECELIGPWVKQA